jgi:hypothetical protein
MTSGGRDSTDNLAEGEGEEREVDGNSRRLNNEKLESAEEQEFEETSESDNGGKISGGGRWRLFISTAKRVCAGIVVYCLWFDVLCFCFDSLFLV